MSTASIPNKLKCFSREIDWLVRGDFYRSNEFNCYHLKGNIFPMEITMSHKSLTHLRGFSPFFSFSILDADITILSQNQLFHCIVLEQWHCIDGNKMSQNTFITLKSNKMTTKTKNTREKEQYEDIQHCT